MELTQKQLLLLNRFNSTLLLKAVSIAKLPLAFITGLKIEKCKGDECVTSVRLKYLNKNPFGSTYFAVLSMAAELSTGALALTAVEGMNPSVALILTNMKADFVKKAIGRTTFTCTEGAKLFSAVNEAVTTKEPQVQTVSTSGCDINGEIVAQFEFTWSFKQRQLDH